MLTRDKEQFTHYFTSLKPTQKNWNRSFKQCLKVQQLCSFHYCDNRSQWFL